MTPTIGFVLVTHTGPEQMLFLCDRLSTMFDSPPIALHHDFSQHPLDIFSLPSNVLVVKDWHTTSWGHISLVEATRKAARLLATEVDPDWYVNLSASDYPIQTAQTILAELARTNADAFIHHRPVRLPAQALPGDYNIAPGRSAEWVRTAHRRAQAVGIGSYRFMKAIGKPEWQILFQSPLITSRFGPFRNGLVCYGGEAWWTVNRRAIRPLIDPDPFSDALLGHLAKRRVPDEIFYHSVLANTPGLTLADNIRYTYWPVDAAHPKSLGREDFPALLASPCHFARKFPFDPELLQELDLAVAERSPALRS